MRSTELSICLPGADAGTVVTAARLAETANLGVWIGDPTGQAVNSDDSYTLTAAAAVAAVTSHIRIGVFLTLTGSAPPLRLAEDVGVVDVASRGRIELGFVVPDDDESGWEDLAGQLLRAWNEWPAGSGREVAATPRPAQPWVSRLVVGRHASTSIADRLHAGVMVLEDDLTDEAPIGSGVGLRRVVLAAPPAVDQDGVVGWLANDPLQTVLDLRATADRLRAHEVMIRLDDVAPGRLEADINALGIVVGAGLRCSTHQTGLLVNDAWNWLRNLGHLHRAPI
jgi:hypothetical protein